MPIDWTDPCAKAAALSEAYHSLLSGGGETMIRYRGPEGEREVRYGKPDMSSLLIAMRAAEDACRASQGLPALHRRFAITAGSRRTGPFRF